MDIMDIMDIMEIMDIMDLIDIMDIMTNMDIMEIMDIIEYIDIMNIMNITAWMAIAGAAMALVYHFLVTISIILVKITHVVLCIRTNVMRKSSFDTDNAKY